MPHLQAPTDEIEDELDQLVASNTAVVDSNNSTSTPLLASQTFTGTATSILPYSQINFALFGRPNTAVSGDATDAKGSVFFEFSPDATNWDISVPIVVRTLGVFIPYPLISVAQYYRLRYLNDGGSLAMTILGTGETPGTPTNQTVFRLRSYLLGHATKELARTLDQGVSGSDPVTVSRAVLMGKDPDGDTYVNLPSAGNVSDNSSTTTLTAGQTFTGTWHSRQGYVSIGILVKTDQLSAADGILIEHSDTAAGTTVRHTDKFTFAAAQLSAGSLFATVAPKSQFFRVRYTNGGTNQGSFFLETNLHTDETEQPRQSVEGQISPNSGATMVRSIVNAKEPVGGTYDNITRSENDGEGRTGLHIAVHEHEVSTPILALTTWVAGQATITSTSSAVNVIPSPTTGRKGVLVKALSSNTKTVFVGPSSAVTSGSGYELAAGESLSLEIDQTTSVWVIGTTAASQSLSFIEII